MNLTVGEKPGVAEVDASSWAVFFGTHSGNCENIGRKFTSVLQSNGIDAKCFDLDDFFQCHVANGVNLIITSSYGDGDPPPNAEKFASQVFQDHNISLLGLNYAVFALGDRNYAAFCGFGRKVDERLGVLGAGRLMDRAECDSGNFELFDSWVRDLLSARGLSFPNYTKNVSTDDRQKLQTTSLMISGRNLLTASKSPWRVYHLELFGILGEQDYEPGDSIAVNPVNSIASVQRTILRFKFNESDLVRVRDVDCKLSEALLFRKELRILNSQDVPCRNGMEQADIGDTLHCESLVARLQTPQQLVDALHPMTPRHYSIASSRSHVPCGMHLTIGLKKTGTAERMRFSLASEYLTLRQEVGSAIHAVVKKNLRFRLPASESAPIIMIGPGTGIAPFRAFLQARQMMKRRGPAWLFFGNRHRETDFLYREELEAFKSEGVLTNLSLAFSRDQGHKIYVQDLMMERGKEIWAWLMRGAHLYVCGNASHMATSVHAALLQIASKNTRIPESQCEKFFTDLMKRGRYQRDVY